MELYEKKRENFDIDLLSYLNIYGNTKESDLLMYGASISNNSIEEIKKILEEIISKGWG